MVHGTFIPNEIMEELRVRPNIIIEHEPIDNNSSWSDK